MKRHVLRHSMSLHRIECAHDRQLGRHVAMREQLIDACTGAGDELEGGGIAAQCRARA
jgi:hypothetical protein